MIECGQCVNFVLCMYEACPIVLQDDFGETALIAAVNRHHHKVAEILLNHGANIRLSNKVRPLMAISH